MTSQELRQIYWLRRELRRLEADLAELRGHAAVSSPRFDEAPRSSKQSDPTYQKTADILSVERKIEECRLKIQERVDFIDSIQDAQIRLIVRLRCEHRFGWRRIAFEVGGNNTEESVRKRYERFFRA